MKPQRHQGNQREERRCQVAVRGGLCEAGRQIGRHDARDEERQSEEAEGVHGQNRSQCVVPTAQAESGPDVA